MIQLQKITLRRGTEALLSEAELSLHYAQKTGLIGANGAGKSSLFALLRGLLTADAGTYHIPQDWQIAHMQQEVAASEQSALHYVLDGDHKLRQIQQALGQAQSDQDNIKIAALYSALEDVDGYTAEARAQKLLSGLGFHVEQMLQPVQSFSGGWRMRLSLAQALMCPSDLLLLDEPTNHLDLDAILWLEDWLKKYPGTLILISHDRDFLDALVQQIVHLDQQKLTLYQGNYSSFERARAERLAQQQQAFEQQQLKRAHMQAFIARFKAQATKAKQAQSRIKALERLETLAPAHIDTPFSFRFEASENAGHPLLELTNAVLGYEQSPILRAVNLNIAPGTRMGLLGPNGAGKSTLIKSLCGSLPLRSGLCARNTHLAIGYFAQHQLDSLDADVSPLEHLQRIAPSTRMQELRDFLGGFDFRGTRIEQSVRHLSGGEKARLALALLAWQKPNLLLLDEPTNHLDLEMRRALTLALHKFSGAVLVVSHDRHLLNTTVNEFVLVAHGSVQPFAGDLEDYAQWLAQYRSQVLPVANTQPNNTPKPHQRQEAAAVRAQKAPYQRTIKMLEEYLEKAERERTILHTQLADPLIYETTQKDQLHTLLAQQNVLNQRISQLEEDWMRALETLEALE